MEHFRQAQKGKDWNTWFQPTNKYFGILERDCLAKTAYEENLRENGLDAKSQGLYNNSNNMPKNSTILIDIGQGFSIMAGLPTISSWNSASRPKNVRRGTIGFNVQTNNLEYWDGTVWFSAPMSEN